MLFSKNSSTRKFWVGLELQTLVSPVEVSGPSKADKGVAQTLGFKAAEETMRRSRDGMITHLPSRLTCCPQSSPSHLFPKPPAVLRGALKHSLSSPVLRL